MIDVMINMFSEIACAWDYAQLLMQEAEKLS